MDYVNLGNTGLKVSRPCLGCMTYGTPEWREWVLDEAQSRPFFERALEAGINVFDTADMCSLGASKMDHLDQAINALDIDLSNEEIEYLEAVYVPHAILDHE